MSRRKIAILLPNLGGGGAERLSLDLAEQFINAGVECNFIVGQKIGQLVKPASAMAEIHDLGASRTLDVLRTLPAAVSAMRPDAIIANIWPLTSISAFALRRVRAKLGIRLALVEHNPLSLQYKQWSLSTRIGLSVSLALGTRLADVRVGVSQGVVNDTARLARMNPARFEVVHNPVFSAPVPTDAELERAGSVWPDRDDIHDRKGRRYLSVGSFKAQKNFGLAIEAFAKIRQPGDHFVILGEGGLRPSLVAQIEQLGIREAVSLPGFVGDTAPFYYSADLFVLSSDYEGFGNVLVEAMGTGLPVVATNCPSGPAEIIVDGQYGELVPVNDRDALAAAMDNSVLRGQADSRKLIERAATFAPRRIAQHYLDLLFSG